jgi:glucose/mannose-6-phosphate isomerase
MDKFIKDFSKHIQQAITIGKAAKFNTPASPIQNILISGLGGSGIGGSIVSSLIANEAKTPISITKDYFIPAFVGSNTLTIASSYSGNTEETIQALESAQKKGSKIVCITSGGAILEKAKKESLDHIVIPSGMPPRAAFGFSSVQLFYVLKNFGVISGDFEKALEDTIKLLDQHEESMHEEAKRVADKLYGKIPAIYSTAPYEGIAVRFRQQLNENSKMLAWHHVLPEMNHNELVGWKQDYKNVGVVMLRNEDDYSRTQKRMEFSKQVFSKCTDTIVEIWSKGKTPIERSYYLIHLCDWVSYLLAEKKKIDATEVNIITSLKAELANI